MDPTFRAARAYVKMETRSRERPRKRKRFNRHPMIFLQCHRLPSDTACTSLEPNQSRVQHCKAQVYSDNRKKRIKRVTAAKTGGGEFKDEEEKEEDEKNG